MSNFPLLFLSLLLLLLLLPLPSLLSSATPLTLPSDVTALSDFKSSITPTSINPWSCLASWNFTSDPCHPSLPTHFTCGITCATTSTPTNNYYSRIIAITLDPAGYSGTLSPSLSSLSLLSHLDIFDNNFHGPIPTSAFTSSLTSLSSLSLSSNSFTGSIPVSLSKLPNIQSIDLSRNALTGPIPILNALTALTSLDLSFNRLSGSIPASLPPNLVQLALRSNAISGALPRSAFQPLKFLEVAELAGNKISGAVEAWFLQLPSLQQVDLANNSLTKLELQGAGKQLVAVDVSFNMIAGELPDALSGYPALAAVSARHNRLTGQIPWGYGTLRRLFLDGNFLIGEVPNGLINNDEMVGSLGDNCLEKCPSSAPICSQAQKPNWVCKQVYGGNRRRRPHRASPAPSGSG